MARLSTTRYSTVLTNANRRLRLVEPGGYYHTQTSDMQFFGSSIRRHPSQIDHAEHHVEEDEHCDEATLSQEPCICDGCADKENHIENLKQEA